MSRAILFLCLIVAGCTASVPPPTEQEKTAAIQANIDCIVDAAGKLDDGVSDPIAVALAIKPMCRTQATHAQDLFLYDMNPEARHIFNVRYSERTQLEQAANIVMAQRAKRKNLSSDNTPPVDMPSDAAAEFALANDYKHGHNRPKDDVKAAQWVSISAHHGYAKAQAILGMLYFNGQVIPQDHVEAMKWYGKAAAQGDVGSQAVLCEAYHGGIGLSKDDSQAYMWCSLAARQGAKDVAVTKSELEQTMTPDQLNEARRLADQWQPHPASD